MSQRSNQKHVVVIGGGNGSAICLQALKNISGLDLSAVISMSDSGGSSGRLRKEFKTLPPGDIMRAILSLSKYDYQTLRNIFYKPRFTNTGKLNSHNLGNLFLTLSARYAKNFLYAIDALSQSVEARGKVYPVTLQNVNLEASLTNGRVIKTEEFIDNPKYNRGLKIEKVRLHPKCQAYDKAVSAIKQADYIILSPGSLYTSLVATLLPQGVDEAIAVSKAKIIYVAGSAYRVDGETGPESLSGIINQLEKYLPRRIDLVLCNNHKLSAVQKEIYKQKKWAMFVKDVKNLPERDILSADFEDKEAGLCPARLEKIFNKIIK